MRIGIITFHWATNFGAVLQAYALQTYLSQHGYDTQIIDYIPYTLKKNLLKCLITKRPWIIPHNLLDYLKELRFREFRIKNLNLSRRYHSFEDLKKNPPVYDIYICGSDQIWNPNFALRGEKKVTLSYFLDFCPNNVKRIAYAVSFGCTQYPEILFELVSPILATFSAVSVRENSGRQLVHKMGINDVGLLPDPTLLLRAQDYESLVQASLKTQDKYSLFYVLHSSQKTIKEIKGYFYRRLHHNIIDAGSPRYSMIGVEAWLALLIFSDIVVTNSYHGMIFSIIFRKPFIVVPCEGVHEDMNDRIFTLLGKMGLLDRIIDCFDEKRINAALQQAIDWQCVEKSLESMRNDARLFFYKNLKYFV
jgi:hypothetical protein